MTTIRKIGTFLFVSMFCCLAASVLRGGDVGDEPEIVSTTVRREGPGGRGGISPALAPQGSAQSATDEDMDAAFRAAEPQMERALRGVERRLGINQPTEQDRLRQRLK